MERESPGGRGRHLGPFILSVSDASAANECPSCLGHRLHDLKVSPFPWPSFQSEKSYSI